MKKHTVQPNITIRQAMKKMSQAGGKCLVIIEDNDTLLGTLTDGDIRKAILKGDSINKSIDTIYQKKPTVLIKNKFRLN